MAIKHVAASGASAGKWVACNAKIQCRNGGLHVESVEIAKIAKALDKRVSDVTLEDVQKTPNDKQKPPNTVIPARKSNVFLHPETPEHLDEHFSPQSQLTKNVYNKSLPTEDEVTEAYYENELKEIVSLMRKDPRWKQVEKEANSMMETMRVEELLRKGHGMMSSEYGDFLVGDFTINDCAAHNIVDLFSSSWTMGSSMDNGLKIAFGRSVHDHFGMGASDFKSGWKSDELYNSNRTFFKVATESIYNRTQSKLTEETYRLARLTDKGNLRPLSSFTGLRTVIKEFHSDNLDYTNENTVVLYADVPKERIFGFYGTALGTAYQSEFIVLGTGRKLPALNNYKSVSIPMPNRKPTKPIIKSVSPDVAEKPASKVLITNPDVNPPKKKGFWARLFGL